MGGLEVCPVGPLVPSNRGLFLASVAQIGRSVYLRLLPRLVGGSKEGWFSAGRFRESIDLLSWSLFDMPAG